MRPSRHSTGEYVKEMAHTNGIESFWSTLKRAHKGTFHKISEKHLQRYVDQFAAKHNIRDLDTIDQMNAVVAGMIGKRLMYRGINSNSLMRRRKTIGYQPVTGVEPGALVRALVRHKPSANERNIENMSDNNTLDDEIHSAKSHAPQAKWLSAISS